MIALDATLAARVERFAQRALASACRWEMERRYPAEAMGIAGEEGLTGLMTPAHRGGLGLSRAEMAGVLERLGRHDMAFSFALSTHSNVTAAIAMAGTEGQRTRHLPGLLSGQTVAAFLLTEPEAGSDAAAIATRARRDGDGWRIEGEKAWVTSGVAAGLLMVFAQTDPALGGRGIAAFLVEADADGVERLAPYATPGGHAAGVNGVRLQVRVGDEAVILAPGQAFKGALAAIDTARLAVAAMCCGVMASALDHALARVSARHAFGQPLGGFQGLQWMLADAATSLEAARLLVAAAANKLDGGAGASVACAHAKKFATRAAWQALGDCMQAMGAHGFRLDAGHPLAHHLAAARMAQWIDGTTEIQNLVIARDLLHRAHGGACP